MKQSLLVAALVALAVSACGKKEEPKPVEAPAPAVAPAECNNRHFVDLFLCYFCFKHILALQYVTKFILFIIVKKIQK